VQREDVVLTPKWGQLGELAVLRKKKMTMGISLLAKKEKYGFYWLCLR
jgi:hypothetical protein